MKKQVQSLPKYAVYDYTDIHGVQHYHTARKKYEVERKYKFGVRYKVIYSYNEREKVQHLHRHLYVQ